MPMLGQVLAKRHRHKEPVKPVLHLPVTAYGPSGALGVGRQAAVVEKPLGARVIAHPWGGAR